MFIEKNNVLWVWYHCKRVYLCDHLRIRIGCSSLKGLSRFRMKVHGQCRGALTETESICFPGSPDGEREMPPESGWPL